MSPPAPYPLSGLELASGLVFAARAASADLPRVPPGTDPRAALERAILPALERAPCLVSFSGGRDSSAVLAVATHVARREGLPLPVPATHRFPRAEGAGESEWQERVISHLGLEDWLRRDVTDELDCVGPVATRVLRRHGLLWPCNAHFHVPLFEAAQGGSLLTGVGGDEAFMESAWRRAVAVLRGRQRPEPRDVLRVALALGPRAVRRRKLERRLPAVCSWLRPVALQAVRLQLADEAAGEPLRWARRFAWINGLHYMEVGRRSLALLAAEADVQAMHPLAEPEFLAALAAVPRSARFEDRSAAMSALFADVLPEELLSRATKAQFDGAFWAGHSRELVARWNGEGVDEELVDVERLREVWSSPEPDARSFTLLQSVWLDAERGRRSAGDGLEQALGSRA